MVKLSETPKKRKTEHKGTENKGIFSRLLDKIDEKTEKKAKKCCCKGGCK